MTSQKPNIFNDAKCMYSVEMSYMIHMNRLEKLHVKTLCAVSFITYIINERWHMKTENDTAMR